MLADMNKIMEAWDEAFGGLPMTVRKAIKAAITPIGQADEHGDVSYHWASLELPYPVLHDVFLRLAGNRGVVDADRLGKRLRGHGNRAVGGRRFVKDGIIASVTRWKRERLR